MDAPTPVWFCSCGHAQANHSLHTQARTYRTGIDTQAEMDHEVETWPCDIPQCDCEDFNDAA